MLSYYSLIALDIARERAAAADARRLAAQMVRRGEGCPGTIRRRIARLALTVARLADREIGTVSLRPR